jgi:hypothetical protein
MEPNIAVLMGGGGGLKGLIDMGKIGTEEGEECQEEEELRQKHQWLQEEE